MLEGGDAGRDGGARPARRRCGGGRRARGAQWWRRLRQQSSSALHSNRSPQRSSTTGTQHCRRGEGRRGGQRSRGGLPGSRGSGSPPPRGNNHSTHFAHVVLAVPAVLLGALGLGLGLGLRRRAGRARSARSRARQAAGRCATAPSTPGGTVGLRHSWPGTRAPHLAAPILLGPLLAVLAAGAAPLVLLQRRGETGGQGSTAGGCALAPLARRVACRRCAGAVPIGSVDRARYSADAARMAQDRRGASAHTFFTTTMTFLRQQLCRRAGAGTRQVVPGQRLNAGGRQPRAAARLCSAEHASARDCNHAPPPRATRSPHHWEGGKGWGSRRGGAWVWWWQGAPTYDSCGVTPATAPGCITPPTPTRARPRARSTAAVETGAGCTAGRRAGWGTRAGSGQGFAARRQTGTGIPTCLILIVPPVALVALGLGLLRGGARMASERRQGGGRSSGAPGAPASPRLQRCQRPHLDHDHHGLAAALLRLAPLEAVPAGLDQRHAALQAVWGR